MKEKFNEHMFYLRIGKIFLNEIRELIGSEEYDKIMNSPIECCKCGFIKKGDETFCPKCEVLK